MAIIQPTYEALLAEFLRAQDLDEVTEALDRVGSLLETIGRGDRIRHCKLPLQKVVAAKRKACCPVPASTSLTRGAHGPAAAARSFLRSTSSSAVGAAASQPASKATTVPQVPWTPGIHRQLASLLQDYFEVPFTADMPAAVVDYIFLFLPIQKFADLCAVSSAWDAAASGDIIWRQFYIARFPPLAEAPTDASRRQPLSASGGGAPSVARLLWGPATGVVDHGTAGASAPQRRRRYRSSPDMARAVSDGGVVPVPSRDLAEPPSSPPASGPSPSTTSTLSSFKARYHRRLLDPWIGDRVEVAWRGKFRLEAMEVYQGLAWWEAVVVNKELPDSEGVEGAFSARYKIHYPGWVSRWDEWVHRNRLRWKKCDDIDGTPIRVNDDVEVWCCGSNVPGAWLEAKVRKVRGDRYDVGRVLSNGSLWVERNRVRLAVKKSESGRHSRSLGFPTLFTSTPAVAESARRSLSRRLPARPRLRARSISLSAFLRPPPTSPPPGNAAQAPPPPAVGPGPTGGGGGVRRQPEGLLDEAAEAAADAAEAAQDGVMADNFLVLTQRQRQTEPQTRRSSCRLS